MSLTLNDKRIAFLRCFIAKNKCFRAVLQEHYFNIKTDLLPIF
jgi:hypothetical protein